MRLYPRHSICVLALATSLFLGQRLPAQDAAVKTETATTQSREIVESVVEDPRYTALSEIEDLRAAGQIALAIDKSRELLAKSPGFGPAWHLLGHLHMAAQQDLDARLAYGRALGLGPATPDMLRAIVVLDQRADRPDTARHALQHALLRSPDNAELLSAYAAASHALGDSNGAQAAIQRAITLEPANPAYRMQLAAILQASGRAAQALNAYETAWLIGSEDPDLPVRIAQLYLQQQDHAATLVWLDRTPTATTIPSTDLALLRAQAHLALNHLPQAATAARLALAAHSDATRHAAVTLLIHCSQDPESDLAAIPLPPDSLAADQQLALAAIAIRAQRYSAAVDWLEAHRRTQNATDDTLRLLVDTALQDQQAQIARSALTELFARHGLSPANQQLLKRLALATSPATP